MKLSRNKIFKLLNKKKQTHKKYKINNKKYNNRSFRNKKKNLNLRKKTLKYNRKKKYNLKGGRKGRYQSGGAGEWWKRLFGATKVVKENIKDQDPLQKKNIENVETILQEWNSLLEPIDKLDKAIEKLETRKNTLMNDGKLTEDEEERLNTMINNQLQIQMSLIKRQTIILDKLNALTNNINLEQENSNIDDISQLNELGKTLSNDNIDNNVLIELNTLSNKITEEDKIDDEDINKSNKLSKTLSSETSNDNNNVQIELQELEEKQKKISEKDLLNNTDPNEIAKELVSALRRVPSSKDNKVEIELSDLGKKPAEDDPQKRIEQIADELRRVSSSKNTNVEIELANLGDQPQEPSSSSPDSPDTELPPGSPDTEPNKTSNSIKIADIVIDEQKKCNNSINWNDGKQYTLDNSDKQLYLCTDKDKFQITDVYGDGNCGYYAIIKGIQDKMTEIDKLTAKEGNTEANDTKKLYNPILEYKQQNKEGEQIKYTAAAVNGIKNLINSNSEDIGLLTDDYLKPLALKLEIPILYTTSPKPDDPNNYLWSLYPAREYTNDELKKQTGIISSNNFIEDSLLSPLLLYHRPATNAELKQERENKFNEELKTRIEAGENKESVTKDINKRRDSLTSVDHWQVISPKSDDNKVYIVYPLNQESEGNTDSNTDSNSDGNADDNNDGQVSSNKSQKSDSNSDEKDKSPSGSIEDAFSEGYPNLTQKLSGKSEMLIADDNGDDINIKRTPTGSSNVSNDSNINYEDMNSKANDMINVGTDLIQQARDIMEKAHEEKMRQVVDVQSQADSDIDDKTMDEISGEDTEFNIRLQFNKEGVSVQNDGPGGGNTTGTFLAFNKKLKKNSDENSSSVSNPDNNPDNPKKDIIVVDEPEEEEQYGGNRYSKKKYINNKRKNKTRKINLTFNL